MKLFLVASLFATIPASAISAEITCVESHRFGVGTYCASVTHSGSEEITLSAIRVLHRKAEKATEKYLKRGPKAFETPEFRKAPQVCHAFGYLDATDAAFRNERRVASTSHAGHVHYYDTQKKVLKSVMCRHLTQEE